MQTIYTFVLSPLLLFSFLAMGQKSSQSKNSSEELLPFKKFIHIENSDSMPFRLLEPIKIAANKKYPLVIFLHGAGERGNDNNQQVKHIQILYNQHVLQKYPGFVLAPQCPLKQSWSALMSGKPFNPTATRPMQLFLQILENVLKEYPVDPARIYVTGVSMGGYGTWDLIIRYPDKFAAAVPVCGGGDEKKAAEIKHVPIWAFHGALDTTVPPEKSRKMIEALRAAGGSPGYTEYPNVEHNSWVHAYKEPLLLEWLFKQKLSGR